MTMTEQQLRRLIRMIIQESVSDEQQTSPEEADSEEEEPLGDEGKVMTVIKIAKEVKGLMA